MTNLPEPTWLRPNEAWQPPTPDYCDWFAFISRRSMAPGLKIIILLCGARNLYGLPTDACTIAILLGNSVEFVEDCLQAAEEHGWLRRVED